MSSSGAVQTTFAPSSLVYVKVADGNSGATAPFAVTLTTDSGDSETLSVNTLVSGSTYKSSTGLPVSTGAVSVGDGTLQGTTSGTITASYINPSALDHQTFFQNTWKGGVLATPETASETGNTAYASVSNVYVKNSSVTLGKDDKFDNLNSTTGQTVVNSAIMVAPTSRSISDGAGGSIILYRGAPIPTSQEHIYGQRIDADGVHAACFSSPKKTPRGTSRHSVTTSLPACPSQQRMIPTEPGSLFGYTTTSRPTPLPRSIYENLTLAPRLAAHRDRDRNPGQPDRRPLRGEES